MKFKTLSVVSSLAVIASMTAPAYAQDADDGGEGVSRTNTIVVTAEFRERNVQDTPIAITAVNAEMLEARGQTNIAQVAGQAPNVTLTPQPQNGGSGLIAFIRGVGQVDFNYALDPGVGVYVDDVFIPTLSSSLLELMDLDRIEVLRGPQGTLAGKNSIGGSIKLFSALPQGDGSGSLRATYGSFNRIEMRGMADFAISDNLFARVSGFGRTVDGYVTQLDYGLTHPGSNVPSNNARGRSNADNTTMGGQSTTAGRLALRWMPTDRLEINLSGDFTSTKGEAGPTVLIAGGAIAATSATFDPFSDSNASSLGALDPTAPFIPGVGRYTTLPWLTGNDGNAVPVNCAFVPSGPYSCDTLTGDYGDPGYIAYSNFLDARDPSSQAPFKPYSALQNQDFSGWGIHGNVTFDVTDDVQLVWIGSWREYESKWGQDQDATPIPVAQLDNQLNHRAWSQEVRLNFELADGMIEGTVGGFWLDQAGEYQARVDLNYAGIDFIHGPDTTPSTTKAVFGTATFHPTPEMSITGGIRYTKDKKVYTYFRSNPDGSYPFDNFDPAAMGPPPICESFYGAGPIIRDANGDPVLDGNGNTQALPTAVGNTPNCLLTGLFGLSDSFEGDRFDWRISADYRFSDEFLAYASVSTGFKGGGVNPRPFFGPSAGSCDPAQGYVAGPCNQLKSFDPETIITYEIGFKADLLDRRLRLNGAAFYNDYSNIILQLSACPASPCLQPNNVGSAVVKGLELEFQAFPVDGLSLDGGVSYLDFQYDAASVAPVGLTGNEITPYTPEWTYSFGVQYDHEIEAGTIMARFDGSYQSETFTDSFNTFWSRIDSRFLGNARVGFTTADEDWNVALEVQNVFDKYYFSSVSDVSASLGVVTGVPGLPRTWSVSVGRRF